jgi:hypothetical protein
VDAGFSNERRNFWVKRFPISKKILLFINSGAKWRKSQENARYDHLKQSPAE